MNGFTYKKEPVYMLRFSEDGSIVMVWDVINDECVRCPDQDDINDLPVGDDLSPEEIDSLEG